ncbi:MAG TPA: hypothetical protein VG733_18075 [Chthoniobacteraceae bacterium]|nr:hypothetical protein [Chthoniobacteraceae bacterium]
MKYLIPFFALLLVAPRCLQAADQPPAHINVQNLPNQATLVDDVVVPVPSEIFGVLDKLGSPNWHDVLRSGKVSPPGKRPQTALLLGTVIAEGFIAVEAQDSEEIKKIGHNVLDLAGAIGVKKSVISRSNAIIEAADKKDWAKARTELDGALHDVKQAMIELHDDELAQLVSLGGWLRGTEALCLVVQKNYTKDGADLLHQPLLLQYFQRRLDGMSPHLKMDTVKTIRAKLNDIAPLVSGPTISPKDVDDVLAIVHELVKSIQQP